MERASPREYRFARWLFWLLAGLILVLIYWESVGGLLSTAASTGERWWNQLSAAVESVLPASPVAPATVQQSQPVQEPLLAAPPSESASEALPQTVGDLIADLQQEDMYSEPDL